MDCVVRVTYTADGGVIITVTVSQNGSEMTSVVSARGAEATQG